jgi:hypothetical protein
MNEKIMKNIVYFIVLVILYSCSENADAPKNTEFNVISIDTVYSFIPGEGQNNGQDSVNYPNNIFGLPSPNATEIIPSNSASQVLSIGLDGEIIVGFKNFAIINKDGPDFIIFENSFINPVNDKIFAEPAEISISEDGINYKSFPFDSLTLIGCAGLTPTYGHHSNLQNWGGDKFDIGQLGFEQINFIKIKDISRIILNNPKHPYYDPIISGFDLDAVIGINFRNK